MAHPATVGAEVPAGGGLGEGEVDEVGELDEVPGLDDAHEGLDPAVEVAVHHARAADVDLRVAAVVEPEDARVLEEAAEDRAHADVLGQALDAGAQGADAAHPDVDLDPGDARPVERVDERLVHDGVGLDDDPPGRGVLVPRLVDVDLLVDEVDEARPHRPRGDEEALEPAAGREAGQEVEEAERGPRRPAGRS